MRPLPLLGSSISAGSDCDSCTVTGALQTPRRCVCRYVVVRRTTLQQTVRVGSELRYMLHTPLRRISISTPHVQYLTLILLTFAAYPSLHTYTPPAHV